MAKIYNGTPHAINIVTGAVFKAEIRKYVIPEGKEVTVVASIPSDGVLSAKGVLFCCVMLKISILY